MEARADDVLLSLTRHMKAKQPHSTPTCFQYLSILKMHKKRIVTMSDVCHQSTACQGKKRLNTERSVL